MTDIGHDLISAVRTAHAEEAAEKRGQEAERATIANLEFDRDEMAARIARDAEAEITDAAIRRIDGDAAAPENKRRRAKLERDQAQLPVIRVEIEERKRRLAKRVAGSGKFEAALAGASLHLVDALQRDARNQVREAFASLAPAVANLLAADHVMAATIGRGSFVVPPGAPVPINGAALVTSILNSLPANLRPEALDMEALQASAREISAPILSQIRN